MSRGNEILCEYNKTFFFVTDWEENKLERLHLATFLGSQISVRKTRAYQSGTNYVDIAIPMCFQGNLRLS